MKNSMLIAFALVAVSLPAQAQQFVARVVRTVPIVEHQAVTVQNCVTETVTPQSGPGGAVTGAIVGGVIGSQVARGGDRALGAGVGAIAGAAIDGSRGAGVGAGTGLIIGTASGASSGAGDSYSAQRRYDHAYIQCMYSKGHRVPVDGRLNEQTGQRTGPAATSPAVPAPPVGAPPPPPAGAVR